MAELPRGTITLVFTDIEGSTRLLHTPGDRYRQALEQHYAPSCATRSPPHAGVEVDSQGDALFHAFARAQDAVA